MKIQKLAVLLIITIAASIPGRAQVQVPGGGGGGTGTNPVLPESLPIGSAVELQAAAWEELSTITMNSWAGSSIHARTNDSSFWSSVYAPSSGYADPDEVFGIVRGHNFTLDCLYETDSVGIGANLVDSKGRTLFYAVSQTPLAKPVNGVSYNTLDLTFDMVPGPFIPLPGVSWYYIVERDTNGNPILYWTPDPSEMSSDGIVFPGYFSGKPGETIVTLQSGLQVAYSNSTGKQIVTTPVVAGVGNVAARGYRSFGNTNSVTLVIGPEENAASINPLCRFTLVSDKELDWVYFTAWREDGSGRLLERCSLLDIWAVGSPKSSGLHYDLSGPVFPAIQVRLPSGVPYWFKFSFPSGFGDLTNQFPVPPPPPYGKG